MRRSSLLGTCVHQADILVWVKVFSVILKSLNLIHTFYQFVVSFRPWIWHSWHLGIKSNISSKSAADNTSGSGRRRPGARRESTNIAGGVGLVKSGTSQNRILKCLLIGREIWRQLNISDYDVRIAAPSMLSVERCRRPRSSWQTNYCPAGARRRDKFIAADLNESKSGRKLSFLRFYIKALW